MTTFCINSSVRDEGSSAFFHIMILAQKSPKIRAQNHECKIRAQFYERKTRNSIFWRFLGNYVLENFWKLYAGKLGWMPATF